MQAAAEGTFQIDSMLASLEQALLADSIAGTLLKGPQLQHDTVTSAHDQQLYSNVLSNT